MSDDVRCVSLGVAFCLGCKRQGGICWIALDKRALEKASSKEIVMDYMVDAIKEGERSKSGEWIFYLSKTIDAYFPQYRKMLDTILLLR